MIKKRKMTHRGRGGVGKSKKDVAYYLNHPLYHVREETILQNTKLVLNFQLDHNSNYAVSEDLNQIGATDGRPVGHIRPAKIIFLALK